MNKILKFFANCLCVAAVMAGGATDVSGQVSFGNATKFNDGWLFSLTDSAAYATAEYADTAWRKLRLPHDWSIEGQISPSLASCTGYLPGGIGWYRKHFTADSIDAKHYLYFEGVYNRSEVYLNGHKIGERPNGYVSFMYDLSPYLKEGDNLISVRVDHSRYADSRWYTGSGIYRDVYLIGAPETHIAQWGIGYRLLSADKDKAMVEVDVAVENPEAGNRLCVSIVDPKGKVVASCIKKKVGEKNIIKIAVPNPRMWDLDSPSIYRLNVALEHNGQVTDRGSVGMGLRTLSFSPDKGFALNGRSMKVKGVCLHHDAGVLGAVVPREVWEQRIKLLKSLGANAIRMSHNPQAPVVYDLCDSLGMLVMDEASDEWEFPKRKWIEGWNRGKPGFDGSYDFFEEWIDRDVTDMVRRDRNHPSVFLWSIGNEVDYPNDPYSHPVLDGTEISQPMYGGYDPTAPRAERIGEIAKRLVACVKAVDKSRPATGALAGVVMSNETAYPEAVDITGYNYTEKRYAEDHATYPERIIFGSETHSGAVPWKAVRDNDFIFGQFIWTGCDYLGESGAWPSRGLGTGLLGFGGIVKPRGYAQAALWCDTPMAWLGTMPAGRRMHGEPWDDWNYEEGDSVVVIGMTNQPFGRLLINGKAVGEPKAVVDGACMWKVEYTPGKVEFEGCDDSLEPVAKYSAVTTGTPYALRAKFASPLKADGRHVAIVNIEVSDAEGNIVKAADNMISCRVKGHARLLGIENSNNRDMSNPRERQRRAFRGQAVAYVEYDGSFTLTFSSPLLKKAEISH